MSAAEGLLLEELSRPLDENPFKFLDFYDEDDAAVFAGRGDDIKQILARFTRGRTFTLFGRSGLGKTSLVRAGLFPRFRQLGYRPIYIRVLERPAADLLQTVREELGRPDLQEADLPQALAGFTELAPADDVDRLQENRPVVLVLDQFEEFFIRFEREPALKKDLQALLRAIASHPNSSVSILFSLREDYIAQMHDLRGDLPDVLEWSHRLLPLTAYGARQAILLALQRGRVPYEHTVIDDLVTKLEKGSFNPLTLQVYATELYLEARRRDPDELRLTNADLVKLGDIEAIYKRYLAELTTDLDSDKALLLCCVLDVLKTADRTKRAVRVEDIVAPADEALSSAVYFHASLAEAEWALHYLVSRRVVRRLDARLGWYELLHDGIAVVVEGWLREHGRFEAFRNSRIMIESLANVATPLSAEQIAEVVMPWKMLLRLSANATGYVFRSVMIAAGDDVGWWAERYDSLAGESASAKVIESWLEHGAPKRRAGAAFAAGRLRCRSLRERVLALALGDPAAEVREQAAEAAARIGDIDTRRLRRAFWSFRRASRARALDVIAQIDIHDPEAMQEFPWSLRVLGRDAGVRRQTREERAARRQRVLMTLGIGAGMGGAWAILVLLLARAYFEPLLGSMTEMEPIAWVVGSAVVIGALLAWRTGFRVHSVERLDNSLDAALWECGRGWSTAGVTVVLLGAVSAPFIDTADLLPPAWARIVFISATALVYVLGIVHTLRQGRHRRPYSVKIDAALILFFGGIAVAVAVAGPKAVLPVFVVTLLASAVWLAVPRLVRSISAILVSRRPPGFIVIAPFVAVIPALAVFSGLLAALVPFSEWIQPNRLLFILLPFFAGSLWLTFLVPIVSAVIAWWRLRMGPQSAVFSHPPSWPRAWLAGSTTMLVLFLIIDLGLHWLPWFAERIEPGQARPVLVRPWPIIHYFRLTPSGEEAIFRVQVEGDEASLSMAGLPMSRTEGFIFETGKAVSFLRTGPNVPPLRVDNVGEHATISTSQMPVSNDLIADQTRYTALPLRCAGGVWIGEWQSKLKQGASGLALHFSPEVLRINGRYYSAQITEELAPGAGVLTALPPTQSGDAITLEGTTKHRVRTLPSGDSYYLAVLNIPCGAASAASAVLWAEVTTGWDSSWQGYPTAPASADVAVGDDPNAKLFEQRFAVLKKLARSSRGEQRARYENEIAIQTIWTATSFQHIVGAIEDAKEAVRLDPKNAEYHDTLAHAYFIHGNYREAREEWDLSRRFGGTVDPLCARDEALVREALHEGYSGTPIKR